MGVYQNLPIYMVLILAKVFRFYMKNWPEEDSNQRPRAYRAHALTTELSGRTMRCA